MLSITMLSETANQVVVSEGTDSKAKIGDFSSGTRASLPLAMKAKNPAKEKDFVS